MKKLFVLMIAMVTSSLSTPAFTDGNDGYHLYGNTPAKAETVSGCAVERQQALTANDKLDKS